MRGSQDSQHLSGTGATQRTEAQSQAAAILSDLATLPSKTEWQQLQRLASMPENMVRALVNYCESEAGPLFIVVRVRSGGSS